MSLLGLKNTAFQYGSAAAQNIRNLASGQNTAQDLMIDIETAGLDRAAPILEVAYARNNRAVQNMRLFPVSLRRDTAEFDHMGNPRTPTWKYEATPIMSKSQMTQEFGTWATSNDKYGMETLYNVLQQLPQLEQDRIARDVLVKDTIDLADYVTNKSLINNIETQYVTPRGMTKQLLTELQDLHSAGGTLKAANMPFESIRLGSTIAHYMDPDNVANILSDPEIKKLGIKSYADLRSMFAANYEFTGKHNILDPNNVDYIRQLRHIQNNDLQNVPNRLIDLWPSFNKAKANTINTQDMLHKVQMFLSGTNVLSKDISGANSLLASTNNLYSLTNVDYLAATILGQRESHTARGDVLQQRKLDRIFSRATNRVFNIQAGLKSQSHMTHMKGYGSALMGIFDTDFQKALLYAESRNASATIADKILNYTYEGTLEQVSKTRSMHRSMNILHETINAYEQYVTGTTPDGNIRISMFTDSKGRPRMEVIGEQFTVADRNLTSSVNWTTSEGATFREIRSFITDRNMGPNMIERYRSLLQGGLSSIDARHIIEREMLAKFHGSKFFQDGAFPMTLDEITSQYDKLKGTFSDVTYKTFVEGDKAFKGELIDTATKFKGSSYAKWVYGTYKKELWATAAIGAALAGMGAYMLGKKESDPIPVTNDKNKEASPVSTVTGTGFSLSTYANMNPLEVVEKDPAAFISLIQYDEKFKKKVDRINEKNNKESLNSIRQLGENDYLSHIDDSILKDRAFNKKADARQVDLSKFNVEVEDADTLILHPKSSGIFGILSKKPVQIRLSGIDAPEISHNEAYAGFKMKQDMPGGVEATNRMKELIDQGNVSLIVGNDITYGRHVGMVYANGENLNYRLAEEGYVAALPYGDPKTSIDNQYAFKHAEKMAFEKNLNMWQEPYYKQFFYAKERGMSATFNSLVSYDRLATNHRYMELVENMETAGVNNVEYNNSDSSDNSREAYAMIRQQLMMHMQNQTSANMMFPNAGRDPRRR